LITGSVYPAQALLFAYLVTALVIPDPAKLSSRADFLSVWWVVVAIVEFIALFFQNGAFGYASEKMVRRVRYGSLRNIARQDISYFDRDENSTGKLTNLLSQEATAMAGLSGVNLGAILTLVVNLVSVITLAYFL
jgi:ATP-binding cassette, subfamily B (MDR/TAP), member 1